MKTIKLSDLFPDSSTEKKGGNEYDFTSIALICIIIFLIIYIVFKKSKSNLLYKLNNKCHKNNIYINTN